MLSLASLLIVFLQWIYDVDAKTLTRHEEAITIEQDYSDPDHHEILGPDGERESSADQVNHTTSSFRQADRLLNSSVDFVLVSTN